MPSSYWQDDVRSQEAAAILADRVGLQEIMEAGLTTEAVAAAVTELATAAVEDMVGISPSSADAISLISARPTVRGLIPAASGLANAAANGAVLQAAVTWAKANGVRRLYVSDGRFPLSDPGLHTFTTPGDNGTLPVAFIGQNGDANIAAETVYNIPVCVKLDDVTLVGNGHGTEFVGPWDYLTGDVDVDQPIGFLFGDENGKIGLAKGGLESLRISGFMTACVCEGIAKNFSVKDVAIAYCGFGILMQGNDTNVVIANSYTFDTYAPFVLQGWWLHRSSTTYVVSEMWPYTGHGSEPSGWSDRLTVDNVEVQYNGIQYVADGIADELDQFYDTYFFKEANSARTSSGGRLSNTDSGTAPAVMHKYYGVTGSGIVFRDRYGRGIIAPVILGLKTRGTWRHPLVYPGSLTIETFDGWYCEDVGYAQPIAGGGLRVAANIVGDTGAPVDRYRGAASKLPSALVGRIVLTSLTSHAPRLPRNYSSTNKASGVPDTLTGALVGYWGNTAAPRFDAGLYVTSGVPTVGNKVNAFDQAISFQPKLYFGSNEQTSISSGGRTGTAVRVGDLIFFNFQLFTASFSKNGTGSAEIRLGTTLLAKALRLSAGSYLAAFSITTGFAGAGHLVGRIDAGQTAGADLAIKLRYLASGVTTTVTDAHFSGADIDIRASGWIQLAADS